MSVATYAKPRTQKGRAVLAARVAQDKLAHDILILDLSSLDTAPADFFVLATCDSEAQLRAVAEAIDTTCKQLGMGDPRVNGKTSSSWVVLDYFDIVVHIMSNEARDFYKLERLWGDAQASTLTPAGATRSVTLARKHA